MPRAKESVRTVPAWGERKAARGDAGQATPVRPVRHTSQTGASLVDRGLVFVLGMSLVLVQEVMVLVLLQLERVGSLVVVTVVFVEVALVGEMFWTMLTHVGANVSALVLLFWY
jgi:hypothetical protein